MAPVDVQAVVQHQFGPGYIAVVDPRLAAPAYAWRPFKEADIDSTNMLDFKGFAEKKFGTSNVVSLDEDKADSWYAKGPRGNIHIDPVDVVEWQYGPGWMAVCDPRVKSKPKSWRAADCSLIDESKRLNFRGYAQTHYSLMADIFPTVLDNPHCWIIIY
jgi:hypothetical protein|uniref:Uncharacterized protein n=1 Tax=Eutreptiella gymnastica TaxID=73025 RepID=A0A6T1Z2I6_9EUGL|eukprot:CAMPEP_0174285640 /NCGR_PEP_ID=MMETSP0809-20121228/9154_1 /TAXON_ID=73025 ORGANISM="Eutreptiella gymnastica-like, Strain CCMP1594" /NCGR_SAMPLE_ID=MMETSP0809 /ASSEMBLY_ACC=CAM_ASM_000658 /LENGTH=158 /DNA_ID=CAMNT_0015381461 /DNA_START=25 /DNA_END=501 /DNA_ORIENTATION=+